MGEQHISRSDDPEQERDDEVFNWIRMKTEDKTGLELAIPVHPNCAGIIDATPSGQFNLPRHRVRSTVHRGRFRQLVPRPL